MSKISVIDTDGTQQDVEIIPNLSLMELLRDAGYDSILAMCGGSCSCATCHVYIEKMVEHQLDNIDEDEEMLVVEADGYDSKRSRLSCQVELTEEHDGLIVSLVDTDW